MGLTPDLNIPATSKETRSTPRQALEYVMAHRDHYMTYRRGVDDQGNARPFCVFSCRIFPGRSWIEDFPLTWSYKIDSSEYEPIDDLFHTMVLLGEIHESVDFAKSLDSVKGIYKESILPLRDNLQLPEQAEALAAHMTTLLNMLNELQARVLDSSSDVMPIPSDSGKDLPGSFFPSDLCTMYLLEQSYLRIMDDNPSRLNRVPMKHGKQFLYGELKSALIAGMIRTEGIVPICRMPMDEGELPIFMDMGAGIGHVVLQVAAITGCRAIGVEILPLPFCLSLQLKDEFMHRLSAFGYQKLAAHIDKHVELIQGNFLEHPRVITVLESLHTVLVNNFTFGSALNQELMDLFLCLSEGAKIISLINFTPLRKRMTDYHRSRPNAIFSIRQVPYPPDSVSWSSAAGHYYVHTVDRTTLRRDMDQMEQRKHETRRIRAKYVSELDG